MPRKQAMVRFLSPLMQDAEGQLAVLQLGSLGLRPDDKAGRQMAG
jgi:hypothetical protein